MSVASGTGRKPSIRQVASVAGVAPSTVSRFLSGKLAVASDVEERITAAMAEVGYGRRTAPTSSFDTDPPLVAVVVPRVDIAYFSDLVERVGDAAELHGLSSVICSTRDRPFRDDSLASLVASKSIVGVVFAGIHRHHSGLERVLEAGLPVVALAEPTLEHELDTVRVDYHSAAHQALAYLASMGHRRIAMIGGPEWLESNQDSLRGFNEAMTQSGLEVDPDLLVFGELSRDFGYSALSRLLLSSDSPSAVFVTADEIALGVYSAARDLGVRLPEDLSIVGSDDVPFAQFLTPALTTVRVPRDRMAQTAIELLVRRLADPGGSEGVQDVVLPPSLQVRQSVAAWSATQQTR